MIGKDRTRKTSAFLSHFCLKFNLMVKPRNSMTDAFLQLHDDPLGTISLYDGLPHMAWGLWHTKTLMEGAIEEEFG